MQRREEAVVRREFQICKKTSVTSVCASSVQRLVQQILQVHRDPWRTQNWHAQATGAAEQPRSQARHAALNHVHVHEVMLHYLLII